jgi:hypothetical protein
VERINPGKRGEPYVIITGLKVDHQPFPTGNLNNRVMLLSKKTSGDKKPYGATTKDSLIP